MAIVAWSFVLAIHREQAAAHAVFWIGTSIMLAGIVLRLGAPSPLSAREGFYLSSLFAALWYLPKLYRSPTFFNFYDEFAHWHATKAFVSGKSAFAADPLNRIVAYYPGLHVTTGALAKLAGLSVFTAGNIVIFIAHTLSASCVYLIARLVVRTPSISLVAAVVFCANPAYVFFDGQFAYESLALPMVAVVVLLALTCVTRRAAGREEKVAATGLAVVLSAVLVIVHHISAIALIVIMVFLGLGYVAWKRWRSATLCFVLAAVAAATTITWFRWVAPYTITYLGPDVISNSLAVPKFFSSQAGGRQLFANAGIPAYEIWGSFAGVVVLAATYVVGMRSFMTSPMWPRGRAAFTGLTAVGACYFLSLPIVWLQSGEAGDVAKRTWEFAFLGLSVVCASAIIRLPVRRTWGACLMFLCLLAVWCNGITTRSGVDIRFPGTFFAASDPPRALTPDAVAAARWLVRTYGPGHRVIGDRAMSVLFGTYGGQYPVTQDDSQARPWLVYFPPTFTKRGLRQLAEDRPRFLIVDLRDSRYLPATGFYFSEQEPGANRQKHPLHRQALEKFGGSPHFDRIFDDGNIEIYRYLP